PELVNRFFDTVTVQKSSSKLCLSLTNIVLSTAVGMIVLSFYHPFLLILVLALLVAIVVLVFGLGHGGVRTAIDTSLAKYETASWLQELARHTTAFCTKGGADFASDRADQLCRTYVGARKKHFRILFRQICTALGLQVLASTAVLGIGGWLVISQQLTPGQLVASELIVTSVVANITKLGETLQTWYQVCAASDKLGHLIDLPLERQEGATLPQGKGGLRLQMHGVNCERPDGTFALLDVSFEAKASERIALLGSTGGSSSYALDVLYGLRHPTTGYVTIDGIDLRQLRLDRMRDEISLVHGTEIVEGTILQNIQFGRADLGADRIRNALADVSLLDEILALPKGLDTPLTTRGTPLSASQASRLMLARAIVREPRVLLLDGALDALPWDTRKQVVEHLFDKKHAWTMIVVSQVEDVIAACDRMLDIDLREAPNAPPPGLQGKGFN
ncbi:MAG: ABC transporter ATP-binding protein, partial [Planctomycetota bacterium]